MLVDYRQALVKDRTAAQNRLRWRLHELDPGYDPPPGSLTRYKTLDKIDQLLAAHTSMVAELGRREVSRIRELTREANQLEGDIGRRVEELVPSLLEIPGCGGLTAAKLFGEAADINRFKSRDAYAMWAGVAPIPVWSANNQRFRLNRGGNRQTNPAIHRIAITQLRIHPDAQTFIQTTTRKRINQTRSPPNTQTKTRQRRLPDPPHRHPTTRPSRRRLT